jgi:uncharacterized membrane protein YfcA
MTIWSGVALIIAAAIAGAINAVAGGGTLVSFPALVWALGDPVLANATSTVALFPASLSSMVAYRSHLGGTRRWLLILTAPSLVGGFLGAWLLLKTPPQTFGRVVPWLILGATALRAVNGPLSRWTAGRRKEKTRAWWAGAVGFQLVVGIYGGYFGAGIGIMMLAAFGLLGMTDIHQMNGLKCFFAFCVNAVAAVWFILAGKVVWPFALLMMAAAIAGGYAGAAGARKLGKSFANAAVLVIGIGVGLWLLFAAK